MPVSFQCGCGKPLRVKDEFSGKKVKCPSCGSVVVAPEITVQDLMAGETSGSPEELQPGVKCQTCGAALKEEDLVCLKCGTIRQVVMKAGKKAQGRNQAQAEKPFYLRPITWVAAGAILICGIFLYYNFAGQPEEEDAAEDEEPVSETGADDDTGAPKQAAPKPLTPEKLFAAELENKDVANFDKMVEYILKLREKSVPVLGNGLANADRLVKLKSLYGLYIPAYFRCYRPQIQDVTRNISGRVGKDEEFSHIAVEMFYLLAADNPDPALLKFMDIAAKYAGQFGQVEKSPAANFAKDSISKQFSQNQSSLVKAKSFVYLVLLGDKWNIRQIINMMKDAQGETAIFIKTSLVELTGYSFDKHEDWNKWYSANKNFSMPQWLINSLESAPESQRQKTIKKLMRITGKDFSYPENSPDEQKTEVINKWKELGKTLK